MKADEYANWTNTSSCEIVKAFLGEDSCPCSLDKCIEDIFDGAIEEFKGVFVAHKLGVNYDYGCPKCHSKDNWAEEVGDGDISCVHCGYIIYKYKTLKKPKNDKSLK